ncbi:MAG: hypothetical protein UV79_C0003G0023 [candidate division TM6 bacterium GW2011_GWF2_43_17]|nr:MAG: hypothetical protein UV79_C0003G0023 [candidate division TM6 bacterium GW2011_GWF2_43_17]HAU30422.1 hypothetical protein [Candidatus Dependentiae bacterium]
MKRVWGVIAVFFFISTASARLEKYFKYAGVYPERVRIQSEGGISSPQMLTREGVLYRKPGARATVLVCHGFMCSVADVKFLRSLFDKYNVMFFDFRAHGEHADKQCCTFGRDEAYDVKAAVDFIRSDRELSALPLISYAFSMGAVSCMNAQARFGGLFDCAVWDCPFESTEDLLARSISNLEFSFMGQQFALPGRRFLKKFAYNQYVQEVLKWLLKTVANIDAAQIPTRVVPLDNVAAAQKVFVPTFYITCKKDAKAPPAAVRRLYEATSGFKRLWITNGRHHFDSFFYDPDVYAYRVSHFIEKFLNKQCSGDSTVVRPREKIVVDGDIWGEASI